MGFSLRGAVNKIGDGGEKLLGKAKKKAGELIDDGAHIVGDGLDHVGLDDAADWVEDKGDHIADHLGAHVAEQQLGQSEEPDELLHGDAGKIREAVLHLAKLAMAFDAGHTGLSHLDPGDWDGFGADAFRKMFKAQPAKWAHAATACAEAGLALENYAETVDWAKGQAKEAVRLWKQGTAARKAAADAYNTAVDTYHDDVKAYNDKVDDGKDPGTKPTKPAAFTDPGAKDKQAAKDTLNAARTQRDSAAATAEAKVRAATKLAPKKPDFTDRMQNDFGDVGKALPIAGEHFVGGLVRSGTDLVKFARGLNPYDPYNLTHPAQYLTHLNATAAGLVDMTQHPERLPGIILGTGWGSDGSEASGRLVGNILLAIATDGGSAAGKAAAEDAAKTAAKDAAEQAARSGARAAAEDPAKAAIEKAAKKCLSDPIDVATGDMVLSQTDIALPGTLPLVLERTHLSSYRIGRFYGPTWASTLDQRLELDDAGVVFVAEDGSVLLYPVPQPGVPALPAHGPRRTLEWDGRPGDPLRITDPETGRTHHFAAVPGTPKAAGGPMVLPLVEVTDRNGNAYTVTYDEAGLPTEVRHSGGYHLTLDSRDGRITALHVNDPAAPATTVRTYAYDDAGNLTAVANSSRLPYRFTYDPAGRITSWTDRNETSYAYTYDPRGRCTATHGTDGFLSSTFTYDDATRTTTFTNSLGHSSTYAHNAAYRLVAETDPLGRTTTQQWDESNDHVVSVTNALGHTTRYEYDDAGNLVQVALPDGSTAAAVYNALGQPLLITEPGGAAWTHEYDTHGNLLTTTDPIGAVTRYLRDARGHLIGVTDPLGHTHRYEVNAVGLPVAGTDPLGNTTRTERDAFGRTVSVTDPLGHTVRAAWTPDGNPAWREDAGGARESWQWDGEGNLTRHTDQAGHVTRYTYTHFDLTATRTDPDGRVHSFAYDTELHLTAVTNPQGLSWTYAHDPAGRVVAETDFNGRTLAYTHDAAGQLATRTNGASQTTAFTRDALGRLTGQSDTTGGATSYAYDAAGLLAIASNADATVTFERDALGRVLSETVNGRTTGYTYDLAGNRLTRTTPSGHTSTWSYDAAGRPTGLDSVAGSLTFGYDAAGRETERGFGDGIRLAQQWDTAGRLAGTTVTDAAHARADRLIHHRTYTYREDGYLTEVRDLLEGTRRYDLDATGRVTGVRAPDATETYAYDTAGNLTRSAAPSGTDSLPTREFTGTLIHRSGRTTYEHDAQGRLTRTTLRLLNGQKRVRTFTWNADDRLVRTESAGTTWHYGYDPLGRRTAKQQLAVDGSVLARTDFAWDGPRLAEQSVPGGEVTSWDYAPDTHSPLTQTATTGTHTDFYLVVTDLVGTPTQLLTPAGTVAWHSSRTPLWGPAAAPTADAGAPACPLRFPGQYADDETGLHYNHHRYYDPADARYLTPDPLGLLPADNDYAYVPNPTRTSDPLGLASCETAAKPKLSDPLPRGMNNKIAQAYDDVKAGRIPSHDTYGGREHPWWKDAKEYRVPGRPETDRILVKELPNGVKVYGWTSTHYQKIQRFSAPHFPDSGWDK
jgi:RHS repeat-associated protein